MMHENNEVAISAFPIQNEYRYLIELGLKLLHIHFIRIEKKIIIEELDEPLYMLPLFDKV